MKKADHIIFGIHVTDRVKHAAELQKAFTEYGCHIKTRLGLHEVGEETCGPNGLVLLEVRGNPETVAAMEKKIAAVEGVQVQKMIFGHD